MFDFAWSELTVIAVVALIVIGPKDLPKALRAAGQVIRRARALAREFQSTFDEVIREAELDEIRDNMKRTMTELEIKEAHDAAVRPLTLPAPPSLAGEEFPEEPIEWLDLDEPASVKEPVLAPKAAEPETPHLSTPEHPPAP